jgi:hypothetical protein
MKNFLYFILVVLFCLWMVPLKGAISMVGADDDDYTAVFQASGWGAGSSLEILDADENIVLEISDIVNHDLLMVDFTMADGCHTIQMHHSASNGWSGSEFYIVDDEGEEILRCSLEHGEYGEIEFSTNEDCLVQGCTEFSAVNYNPYANTDDGSCLMLETSSLPLVFISTYGEGISDDPRVVAHMGVVNNTGGENHVDDFFTDYDGQISIEIRGSSSQTFMKKSYGFETQDDEGENNNVSLLGMPEENDWVLHGPYSDKTLMRNAIVSELGRKIGRYTPRGRFCELIIDDRYSGVYLLLESIKRDKNRVDIAKLKDDDIEGDELTGGYILKIDRNTGEFNGSWPSDYPALGGQELKVRYHKPEAEEMEQVQKDYIREYVSEFEDALAADNFDDGLNGFRNYVEVASFIDQYFVNEFSRNVDGYRLSTFFHKRKDSDGGRLIMGPWWDFNLAFANCNFCEAFNPEGWEVEGGSCYQNNPFWFERMLEDSLYANQLACTWEHHRATVWSDDEFESLIDSLENHLEEAAGRNFARWVSLGSNVWPNYFVGDTYEEEVDYLKNWTFQRLAWMDEELNGQSCLVGCTDMHACNYMPGANIDDGFCEFTIEYYDCDGNCLLDADNDGLCDQIDNCVLNYNPGQEDCDGDGIGNSCDNEVSLLHDCDGFRRLIKVVDTAGRQVDMNTATGLLIYMFDDGSIKKVVQFRLAE